MSIVDHTVLLIKRQYSGTDPEFQNMEAKRVIEHSDCDEGEYDEYTRKY